MGEKGECSRRKPGDLEVELILKKKEERRLCGGALVGKIMTKKNLNIATSVQMIRKGWNLLSRDNLEIAEVDRKAFVFEFRRREDYIRILRGRPWSINGFLLNIQRWEEDMIYNEVDFNFSPFWIQFHDLPLAAMDIDNALRLGELIGEVVMVEDPRAEGLLTRSFLRARVLVDLRKPLVTSMWSPREEKEPLWIKARYERLQSFCFVCGRMGHDLRSCSRRNKGSEECVAEYGSWLSIQAARWIKGTVKVCKDGWEEVEGWKAKMKNKITTPSQTEIEQRSERNVMKTECKKSNVDKVRTETKGIDRDKEVDKENYRDDLLPSQKEGESVLQQKGIRSDEGNLNVITSSQEVCRKRNVRGIKEGAKNRKGGKEDLSKAIVLFGSISPMSEVVYGLKKIGLKRRAEDMEDKEILKRRKFCFEDMAEKPILSTQLSQKKGERKNVRLIRRKIRQEGGISSAVKIQDSDNKLQSMDGEFVFNSKASGVCGSIGDSGCSDWPKSVTMEP